MKVKSLFILSAHQSITVLQKLKQSPAKSASNAGSVRKSKRFQRSLRNHASHRQQLKPRLMPHRLYKLSENFK
jgi:hypothetical protein